MRMAMFKLSVSDRGYEGHTYTRTDSGEAVEFDNDPYESRMFDGDVVSADDGSLISSLVREGEELAGVLVLDDKCKYGKQKDKFLYKCIPDRPGLPFFLLPRKEPKAAFSTKRENVFVVFRFAEWGAGRSFPVGSVVRTIGLVSDTEAFYEYQVVRRGLHVPMGPLAKKAVSAAKAGMQESVIRDDRTDRRVFTIDPEGCRDFDDAVGVQTTDDGFLLSVYIANVPSCLEKLKLWDFLSDRVATIYMPDRKWPMLPPVLSESLCSLVSGSERDVLAMDVALDRCMVPVRFSFSSTRISVSDNFVYESEALSADRGYELLRRVVGGMSEHDGCGPPLAGSYDSHDVVERLMVIMNHQASLLLNTAGRGIFRSVTKSREAVLPDGVLPEVANKVHIWKGLAGRYVSHGDDLRHEALGLPSYVHITSPIRRLADLINMVEVLRLIDASAAPTGADSVLAKWYSGLEVLNKMSKDVQRAQTEAAVLCYCIGAGRTSCRVTGYPFMHRKTDSGVTKYKAYVPELKTVCDAISPDGVPDAGEVELEVRVFEEEASLARRVRVSPIMNPS